MLQSRDGQHSSLAAATSAISSRGGFETDLDVPGAEAPLANIRDPTPSCRSAAKVRLKQTSTSVRPSDACVLQRRRLTFVDNTGSSASAVNTTLATAVAARTRRADGRTDGRTSRSESGQ
ncbi:hypothetical protein V3C99_018620 [Haemonchus contortus]|uniref:Uncharacterized protein n=1 Tax=Haemonchus contortus TaxID=6289 RepID=A0A7I4Z4G2_HAECO